MPGMEPSNHAVSRTDQPPSFVCQWRTGRYGSLWIDVAGELDLEASAWLGQVLRTAQSYSSLVVLDLRALSFIEVAGARAIAEAGARARSAGRGLIVARGPAEVDRVFKLTGAARSVELFDLDPMLCPVALGDGSLPPPVAPAERPRRRWRRRGPTRDGAGGMTRNGADGIARNGADGTDGAPVAGPIPQPTDAGVVRLASRRGR